MSRMTDQIGRVLSGRYRLIAPVGTGASAQVYLADDVRLRRRVAVKILHAALADDDAFLRRFRAEAQAAAALNHPNIVAVYDWGDDDGAPYIVTEYLGGGSLRAVLDQGMRLSQSQALLIGLEATRALDYAHRRGFVHRDVKPANIMFGDDARLRIADFGLARALAEAAWTEPQGAVLGTARYASPEQAQGQPVDGKADVYSLGLVLIEAVTGSVPFSADTTIATLMARVGKPVEVPDALGPLQKPLARAGLADPGDRPDAGELAIAFMACAEDLPRPEPLPLASTAPVLDLTTTDAGQDATMLGAALGGSRLAEPGDDTGVVDAPPTAVVAPPEYLDDDLAIDGDTERSPRRWPWVLVTALLAVLMGTGAAFAWDAVSTPSYEVPSLIGLTEEEARAQVAQFGFDIERRTTRQDGSTPGAIVDTDPAAGEQLDEGGRLVLYVSLGNTPAPVPTDLADKTLEEATEILDAAGQFTPDVTEVESEDVPAGIVIGLGEGVGAELPKGSAVPITVSKGPAPRTIPTGLEGKSFDEAAAALEAVQLRAKQIEEFSDDVEEGAVIGLRPGEGTAPRDSEIEVVVSKGPDLVEVPRVQGRSLDEAVAAIEDAGLVVGDAFGPANGRPFITDPAAGTEVKRGATVDIYLRR
ncbi:MAG TPA: PASTA domain-containing protein [Acidimicrobiia bacterium]|nr:PASTA domain-containing protein [Acidimicrobiia bacterium]